MIVLIVLKAKFSMKSISILIPKWMNIALIVTIKSKKEPGYFLEPCM
jgi:hypothetical protein